MTRYKERLFDTEALTDDYLLQVFLDQATQTEGYSQALEIGRKNSTGGIWLIGGFVFRNIVKGVYDTPVTSDVDFDFIVDGLPNEYALEAEWSYSTNSYGNPKLIGGKYEIDLIPLKAVHSITRREVAPTIKNFLTGTPLTIQSIVYDVNNNCLVGEIGLNAIRTRTVAINNPEQAIHSARLKGISVSELVTNVAKSLQFDYQL
jgi:hypothetical protein